MPTDKECINGVKRLYRMVVGRPWRGKVVVVHHRRRRTWGRWDALVVSPEYRHPAPGWPAIVHDLSHYLMLRIAPGAAPHDSRQARLEREMQQFVIKKLL
jgi:hypothetical protein